MHPVAVAAAGTSGLDLRAPRSRRPNRPMRNLLPSLAAALFATVAVAQSPLTTMFAAGNGGTVGGGVYFDLDVLSPTGVVIFQIDCNANGTAGGLTGTLDVLTHPGPRVGTQTNAAAWNGPASLGNAVTTVPVTNPTVCLLATPIALPPGLHAIALRANGFAHAYTNGNGTNQVHGNADLTLTAGEATNTAFTGIPFTPRVVNCRIHYSTSPPGAVLSSQTSYGNGCVAQADSCFYEQFPTAVSFDLANSGMGLIHTGSGYVAVPGFAPFVPPSGAANILALGNDGEVTVPLSTPFLFGRSHSTNDLTVCANGRVSIGPGNFPSPALGVTGLLDAPITAWWCWHDFDPTLPNGGRVRFEEANGTAFVTWEGVWDAGGSGQANASTFQMQFFLNTGHMHFVWQQMSSLGNHFLVGFSEGGVSPDPGSTDLSVAVPGTFSAATFAIRPLDLTCQPRPIVQTTVQLTTSGLTPTTAFGAVSFGLQRFAVPIHLAAQGMPGCFQYHDMLANQLFVPARARAVTTTLVVPNLIGLQLQVQSFAFDPIDPVTPLGAVTSPALELLCGDW